MAEKKVRPRSQDDADDDLLDEPEEVAAASSSAEDKPLRPKDLPALVRSAGQPELDFISVGFGSSVAINRVLAVVAPDSAPIRRLLRDSRDKGLLIDATFGRKTKAVLILDSGHVLTAALQPETIIGRVRNRGNQPNKADS